MGNSIPGSNFNSEVEKWLFLYMHSKEMTKMALNVYRIAKTSHHLFKEIKHGELNLRHVGSWIRELKSIIKF